MAFMAFLGCFSYSGGLVSYQVVELVVLRVFDLFTEWFSIILLFIYFLKSFHGLHSYVR